MGMKSSAVARHRSLQFDLNSTRDCHVCGLFSFLCNVYLHDIFINSKPEYGQIFLTRIHILKLSTQELFCIECILCLNIHNWNTTLIIDVIYYLARNNYISILNVSLFLMKVSCYVLPSRGFPTTYQKPWVHNTICN